MQRVDKLLHDNADLKRQPTPVAASTNNTNRIQAIVTIPVVFHVVLSNPYLITDAMFAGFNKTFVCWSLARLIPESIVVDATPLSIL